MSLPEPYYHDPVAGITIYNCDCRDILPYLPKVDLVLTDPPYGIGTAWSANHTGGFINREVGAELRKWDSFAPIELIAELPSLGKYAIIWGSNYFGLPPHSRFLIWDKCLRGMHFAEAEIAWTNFDFGTSRVLTFGIKGSEIFGTNSERKHPTQKPLKVMSWCLSFFPDAETILDPFMGSGTTLVAAKLLGKKCIGIEIDEKYCRIAVERLAQGNLFTESK